MKLGARPFPLIALLAAAELGVTFNIANAYVYSSGPHRSYRHSSNHPPKKSANTDDANFASSPRSRHYKQRQQERINQAFRELQNEFSAGSGQQLDGIDLMTMGSKPLLDPFFKKVDKDVAKKWVDKAFDLASEFNNDFSDTPEERENMDEILQESRDWVNGMCKDQETEAANNDEDETSSTQQPDSVEQGPSTSKKAKRSFPEIPNAENRSNEEQFKVAIDLPGVERADVDVALDGDFLVIEATRRSSKTTGSEDKRQPIREYRKKLAFVEQEVDIDQLEANLSNGVLLISAPKKKATENKRKIRIT